MLDKTLSRSLSICSSEVAELEHHSGQSATRICNYILRLVVPLHWRVEEISISKNQVLLDHMEPELLQPHSAHRCEQKAEKGSDCNNCRRTMDGPLIVTLVEVTALT